MSESGYYPPGAEHDPRAPYNQPEDEECPDCADCVVALCDCCGERKRGRPGAGGSAHICNECAGEECERCDDTGYIAPPTHEEIEEEKADRQFDRERDEGRI